MHLYGIIDDSIYEEAIKRTEKTYNNYIWLKSSEIGSNLKV
jgi:hypothetical protein